MKRFRPFHWRLLFMQTGLPLVLLQPGRQELSQCLGVIPVQAKGIVMALFLKVDVGEEELQAVRGRLRIEAQLVSTAIILVLTGIANVEPVGMDSSLVFRHFVTPNLPSL